MGAAVFVGELLLLLDVHAPVGFGEKLFRVVAIIGEDGASYAE